MDQIVAPLQLVFDALAGRNIEQQVARGVFANSPPRELLEESVEFRIDAAAPRLLAGKPQAGNRASSGGPDEG